MKVKTSPRRGSAGIPQLPPRFRFKAAASLLLGGAVLPACALAVQGPYLGIEAGPNWSQSEDLDQKGFIIGAFDSHIGYSLGGVYGFAFPFGLRPEFELNYRRNDYQNSFFGPSLHGVGGYNSALSGMGNLWYDFKLPNGFFSRVHPYLGGGVGVVRVGVNHVSIDGVGLQSDHNFALGYQGGAGVAFDLAPNLTLSTDWRFLETNREDYKLGIAGGDTRLRYRAQTAMIGLKFGFGGPPPPPPPVAVAAVAPPPPPPPPPPAPVCKAPPGFQVDANCNIIEQTLVVHQVDFEFNSDRLTAPAQATLDPIAAALAQQPNLTISVNGYTDNIGSAAYNRKLSQRRAVAVRAYLVSKGVNAASLNAEGYGKDNPIASNDSVEGRAQNRRVEFVIRNAPEHLKVEQQGATAATTQAAEESAGAAKTAAHHARHRKHHPKPAAEQPQQ